MTLEGYKGLGMATAHAVEQPDVTLESVSICGSASADSINLPWNTVLEEYFFNPFLGEPTKFKPLVFKSHQYDLI